jgi:hypothetical protein
LNDKLAHFIVGFGLSIIGILHMPLIFLGFFFGVGKELLDFKTGRGKPEWMDMWATFCGAGIATGIVLLIGYMPFYAWH